jgi:transcriptional regulator with GAF, ATPase, and Fis domain
MALYCAIFEPFNIRDLVLIDTKVTHEMTDKAVHHRRFDRLLAQLSSRFVDLAAEAVDGEIQSALERIGSFIDADRVILTEFNDDGSVLVVKHSWARAGVVPIQEGALMGPRLPHVFAALRRGEIVHIPDTEALVPEWHVDLQEFRWSGAKAHLSIPFAVAGSPVGVFTVVSVREPRPWSDEQVEHLNLLAQVFANALSRRNTEQQLRSALSRIEALQARLQAENLYLRDEIGEAFGFDRIIGSSAAIESVQHVVEHVAPTDATVLIQGETGTGKELVARAIHEQSSRHERPLIKVNCAALPSSLAESELFGHEKGAFTGAVTQRMGRFELADGGTIFLDEVGDLPLDIQAKLLRVLQEGEFERLGSAKTHMTDVRVLAATGRDLQQVVQEGSFRADLFYRLRVVPVEMPPLRQRPEDIPALVWFFIEKNRAKHGKLIRDVPEEVMENLLTYDWPGNVRELENVIERAIILSPDAALSLPDPLVRVGASAASDSSSPGQERDLAGVERSHIIRVLESCNWKVKGEGNAAERLGLNPSTLRGRMRKLGIERPFRTKKA